VEGWYFRPVVVIYLNCTPKLWRLRLAANGELSDELEEFVADLVASSRYRSKREVLQEGVRLVLEREARLSDLDAAIARGVADADAGRVKPAAEVFDRLEAKYRAMGQTRGS
jgi:antitoxin ParD1/3/4